MKLTQATQDFILHWGEMGAKWGVNRSVAQIHALLHISPDPMTADEICEVLNLARSNVSNGLKELQAWKLVKVSRQLGDRRDHFTSIRDMFDLVNVVIEGRHVYDRRLDLRNKHLLDGTQPAGTAPPIAAEEDDEDEPEDELEDEYEEDDEEEEYEYVLVDEDGNELDPSEVDEDEYEVEDSDEDEDGEVEETEEERARAS